MSRRKLHKPRKRPFMGAGVVAMAVERYARHSPDGVRVLCLADYGVGDSSWVDGLRERVLRADMPRCRDLERHPGDGYVYAGEGYGRCLMCHVAATAAAGEESSGCGRCGTPVESAESRPIAVQLGSWVMCSTLCVRCVEVLAFEIRLARRRVPAIAGR
ncbi:hypothetical protein ACIBL8_44240 [Streptomyces sp. NPDC050523]|uniref:hypothetical protein n=1 Tax=Streptomyces sp. NPDC050523 TaxID=3365622 RepID=UPI00379DB44A